MLISIELEFMKSFMENLINHIAKFVELSCDDIDSILKEFQLKTISKKEMILQEGQICRHNRLVIKGCFKLFNIDEKGNEHISRFALEDWWLGDLLSFTTQSPATTNIQALEHSVVAQISFENLQQLYIKAPVMERFFRLAYERSLAHVLLQKSALIATTAEQRYQKFLKTYPEIGRRVPLYMIASYLGMTPVSLSNIRKKHLFALPHGSY